MGIAFQRTHRHMDELVRGQGVTRFHLLTRDGEHPSPCGQLLSALVVAITITGTSPHTLKWWVPDGIETKQAQFMRGVAGQTVLEYRQARLPRRLADLSSDEGRGGGGARVAAAARSTCVRADTCES